MTKKKLPKIPMPPKFTETEKLFKKQQKLMAALMRRVSTDWSDPELLKEWSKEYKEVRRAQMELFRDLERQSKSFGKGV